jgi:hypothetical protein
MGHATLGRAAMTTEQRLRALEEQLHKAQGEIERLRGEVQQQKAISQGAQTQIEEARKQQEDQGKKIEETKKGVTLPDWAKKVAVFGDLRLRHEGFYNQPTTSGTAVTARNRERVRARLGVKYTFSDELSATIRLASGNPNDPISTNQTLTNDFTPKNINLDWAYLTLTPGATFGMRPGFLSLTGGKFPNPIFRTSELVFDDDLALEGATQTVQLLSEPVGPLQQVKVYAFQGTYNEISNAQDGWLFGGQIAPSFRVGPAEIEAGVGQYGFLNVNQIAMALNTNSSLKNTNLTVSDSSGITAYQSTFNETNAALAVTFPNAVGAKPVRLFGDYVHNWGAVNSANNGWLGGAMLGQTKVQGDWAVSAAYERLEQEATLSAYSNSDFGFGGTNNQGPVVQFQYQLLNPLTVAVRNYFTNYIDTPAGSSNPTMFRLQLDAMVKF